MYEQATDAEDQAGDQLGDGLEEAAAESGPTGMTSMFGGQAPSLEMLRDQLDPAPLAERAVEVAPEPAELPIAERVEQFRQDDQAVREAIDGLRCDLGELAEMLDAGPSDPNQSIDMVAPVRLNYVDRPQFAMFAAKDGFEMLGLPKAKHDGQEASEQAAGRHEEELARQYGGDRYALPVPQRGAGKQKSAGHTFLDTSPSFDEDLSDVDPGRSPDACENCGDPNATARIWDDKYGEMDARLCDACYPKIKGAGKKVAHYGDPIGYTMDGAFYCADCARDAKDALNGECQCDPAMRDENGLCAENCHGYGPNAVLDGQDTEGDLTCDTCGEQHGHPVDDRNEKEGAKRVTTKTAAQIWTHAWQRYEAEKKAGRSTPTLDIAFRALRTAAQLTGQDAVPVQKTAQALGDALDADAVAKRDQHLRVAHLNLNAFLTAQGLPAKGSSWAALDKLAQLKVKPKR